MLLFNLATLIGNINYKCYSNKLIESPRPFCRGSEPDWKVLNNNKNRTKTLFQCFMDLFICLFAFSVIFLAFFITLFKFPNAHSQHSEHVS